MLVVLTKEENDYARQRKPSPSSVQANPLEQGQADRSQAAAAAKTRLVDPHQASNDRPQARLGAVQSRHRQQTARLRCRLLSKSRTCGPASSGRVPCSLQDQI